MSSYWSEVVTVLAWTCIFLYMYDFSYRIKYYLNQLLLGSTFIEPIPRHTSYPTPATYGSCTGTHNHARVPQDYLRAQNRWSRLHAQHSATDYGARTDPKSFHKWGIELLRSLETCVLSRARMTWGAIRACSPCEVRRNSCDIAVTCLRVFTIVRSRARMKP